MFDSDVFVESINIAKWQVWLACLSDLSVYAGVLLAERTEQPRAAVTELIESMVADVLTDTGTPKDAGAAFQAAAVALQRRIRATEWETIDDGEQAFELSPAALVEWAPIVEDIKRLDEQIVLNSVRFRWHEVRRELRRELDADALFEPG